MPCCLKSKSILHPYYSRLVVCLRLPYWCGQHLTAASISTFWHLYHPLQVIWKGQSGNCFIIMHPRFQIVVDIGSILAEPNIGSRCIDWVILYSGAANCTPNFSSSGLFSLLWSFKCWKKHAVLFVGSHRQDLFWDLHLLLKFLSTKPQKSFTTLYCFVWDFYYSHFTGN